MKLYFLILALALTACTTSPTRTASSVEDRVYLDTQEFPSEAQSRLLLAATGQVKLTSAETRALLEQHSASSAYNNIIAAYSDRLITRLGIDPTNPHLWFNQNKTVAKGIKNYVGSSDESMADEEGPDWQNINKKLREDQNLDEADLTFINEINLATGVLPTVKGLVFRGQRMTKERFNSIPLHDLWPQKAFTSTSLDYGVAHSFGSGHPGRSRRGVLIIKTKGGAPVSPLTFDTGYMGQPGRVFEYEVLLSPGSILYVHDKIEDSVNDIYFIFAEER